MPEQVRASGNPFPADGVSKYPPVAPLVGQPEALERLTGLVDTMITETGSCFCAIYGDWGIGKTRLAHELVAEACGRSKGWLVRSEGEGTSKVERHYIIGPLAERGVLPLFITFTDVLHHREMGITLESALPKAACMAMAALAELRGQGSQVQMAYDLQAAIRALAPAVDFDELNSRVTNGGASWTERANLGFAYLQEAARRSGARLDKLLIIIDEIETASEFTPANTPEERRTQEYPIEALDIKTLFSAVKAETDRASLPGISFLLLCSPGVRRVATIEAIARRVKEATLDKATGEDLQVLLDSLAEQGYLSHYPGDLARAAFLAADRNFGWFSYIMNPIYRQLLDAANSAISAGEDYDILNAAGRRLGRIFRQELVDEMITDEAIREPVRRIVYHQVPATMSHLGLEPEAREPLLAYTHSYGMHVVSEVRPVRLDADRFVRALRERGYREESAGSVKLLGEGSAPFAPGELLARFTTFRNADSDDILAFTSPGEFASQLRFVTTEDLTDSTVSTIHAIFQDHVVPNSEPMLAPSVAFMLKFNLRWGSLFDPRWLPDKQWEALEKQVKQLSLPDVFKRVCEGTAKVLHDHPTLNAEVKNVKNPHVVLKLDEGDPMAVTKASSLIVLYGAEPVQVVNDLVAISRNLRAPCLLIFQSEEQLNRWRQELVSGRNQSLATLAIPRVIASASREHEFLVRWSYRDSNDGYPASEVRERGRLQREEYEREWKRTFESWFGRLEEGGYLLKPIVSRAKTYEQFRSAYGLLAAGQTRDQVVAQAGGPAMQAALDEVVTAHQTTRGGTLRLLSDDGSGLIFPNVFARVLNLLSTPQRPDDLAEQLFYQRTSAGAFTSPKSAQTVVEQVLGLLQQLGLVEETQEGTYATLDAQRLGSMLTRARDQLGSFGAAPSNFVKIVREWTKPMQALAFSLKVNENQLQLLADELTQAQNQLGKVDLDSPKRLPADQDAFLRAAGLVRQLRQTALKVSTGGPKPPKIDPCTLTKNLSDIAADDSYARYPVEYRVQFLREVAAAIAAQRQRVEELLRGLQAKVKVSFGQNGDGSPFPTSPIDSLLTVAIQDLAEENVILPEEFRARELSANLHTYVGAGELDKAFQRLNLYTTWLDESNPKSLWGRFLAAHSQWQQVLRKATELGGCPGDEVERYFEGDPNRNQWVSEALATEVAEKRRRVADFAAQFAADYPQPRLGDLEQEVMTTGRAIDELIQRAKQAQADGRQEIDELLKATALPYLQRLAARMGKPTEVPDPSSLDGLSHIEQHSQVSRLDTRAKERGAALVGDSNWFSVYRQVCDDCDAGLSGDELRQKYGMHQLEHLNSLGAIRLETKITVET